MISPTGQRSPFPGAAGYSHAPNAALLIDFDNVTMGIRSDLGKELKALLNSDVIRGKVAVQRAYADWRRYPQYIVPLAESSIDLIFAPAYGSSKKNATDLRMAIDAIELVFTRPEIGTFILMTGDSDFSSCVLKLKEYGKYVIGVGMRESSSDLLIQNCDEYYSYHSLSGLTRTGEVQESTEDPWVLVKRAAQQMEANGDVMRTDRLKQVMLDLDPAFDEKKIGYSKFSRFVQEAANKGVVRLRKGENGQYELVRSEEAEAETEAAAPAESRRGRGREREREGRRDGRREPRPPREEEIAAEAPAEKEAEAIEVPQPVAEAPAVAAVDSEAAIAEDGTGIDQAYALLQAALRDLTSGGTKAVRDGDVKRRMLDLSPGFDEADLGFSKFTRFLRQAHDAEVIDLQRSNGGNYEVALPASGKRMPPPRTAQAAPTRPKEPVAPAAAARAEQPAAVAAEPREPTPATPLEAQTPAAAAREEGAAAAATSRTVGVGALRGRRAGRPGAPAGPPPILPGQAVAPTSRTPAEPSAPAAATAEVPVAETTGEPVAAEAAAPAAEEARKKSRRGRRGRGRGRGAEAEASAEVPGPAEEPKRPEAQDQAARAAKAAETAAATKGAEPVKAVEPEKEKPAEAPKRTPPPEGPIDKITARARRGRAIRGDADEAVGAPSILPGQAAKAPAAATSQAAEEKAQPSPRTRGRGRGRKAAEPTPQPAAKESAIFSGLPVDREGVIAHLSAYRGVGAKTAEALYDRFGEGTFQVLETRADDVRELIGPRRAATVLEQWGADAASRRAQAEAEKKVTPEAEKKAAPETRSGPGSKAKSSSRGKATTRRSSSRTGARTTSAKATSTAAPEAASTPAPSAPAKKESPKRGGRGSRGGGRRKKETTPSS